MHQDIKEILFTEEQIAARVRELGAQITKDYAGKTILMCGILKGAVTFFTDLARCIDGPVYFDFMSCSSYGSSTTSSGVLKIRKDLDNDVKDKDVLIVEDIIDSGLTMQYLRQLFGARNPASITTISFLDKATRHPESYKTDMCGFEIPDEFVVGYGLDYANYYRNLPYIGVLKPECYQ